MTLLQFEVYLYNDEIIREGTIGRKMFFISRGAVIVNAKTQTHTLTHGVFLEKFRSLYQILDESHR